MSTAMRIEVEGQEMSPEDVYMGQGWKTECENLNVSGGSQGNLHATRRDEGTDLRSKHTIIGIEITRPRFCAALIRARITDWDKLRKYTDEASLYLENKGEHKEDKQTYVEWARDQRTGLAKFTQVVTRTVQMPFVNARLAHMWEARQSLTR
ncbi:hypothetical protein HPB48_019449 [Haemaphysalis longicornis]|uniref:Uncharacterized protein n=1 Tax=Haemaphysalis longicornis TaxID=44386 RepID=A0A9J6GXC2_HAELO|nr:hypothetical protein HPB48_019449 [Haemaphysalis longicornis]